METQLAVDPYYRPIRSQGHDQHTMRHPFRSVDRRRRLQHDGQRRRGGHDLRGREAVRGQPEADRLQDAAEGVGKAWTVVRITLLGYGNRVHVF